MKKFGTRRGILFGVAGGVLALSGVLLLTSAAIPWRVLWFQATGQESIATYRTDAAVLSAQLHRGEQAYSKVFVQLDPASSAHASGLMIRTASRELAIDESEWGGLCDGACEIRSAAKTWPAGTKVVHLGYNIEVYGRDNQIIGVQVGGEISAGGRLEIRNDRSGGWVSFPLDREEAETLFGPPVSVD